MACLPELLFGCVPELVFGCVPELLFGCVPRPLRVTCRAGVAAGFNAPISGVFFAVETVLQKRSRAPNDNSGASAYCCCPREGCCCLLRLLDS